MGQLITGYLEYVEWTKWVKLTKKKKTWFTHALLVSRHRGTLNYEHRAQMPQHRTAYGPTVNFFVILVGMCHNSYFKKWVKIV